MIMKVLTTICIVSSISYRGILASEDRVDLEEFDTQYNARLDQLLEIQHELQSALNELLNSSILNEDSKDDEGETPPTYPDETLETALKSSQDDINSSAEKESETESDLEAREAISEDQSDNKSELLSREAILEEESDNKSYLLAREAISEDQSDNKSELLSREAILEEESDNELDLLAREAILEDESDNELDLFAKEATLQTNVDIESELEPREAIVDNEFTTEIGLEATEAAMGEDISEIDSEIESDLQSREATLEELYDAQSELELRETISEIDLEIESDLKSRATILEIEPDDMESDSNTSRTIPLILLEGEPIPSEQLYQTATIKKSGLDSIGGKTECNKVEFSNNKTIHGFDMERDHRIFSDPTATKYTPTSTIKHPSLASLQQKSMTKRHPVGYLKDISPSDLEHPQSIYHQQRSMFGTNDEVLSYQAFKPTGRGITYQALFDQTDAPMYDDHRSVYTPSPIRNTQELVPSENGGNASNVFRADNKVRSHRRRVSQRRSKLGQYAEAAMFWQVIIEQAMAQPPVNVYVDIRAVESHADSLTRMSLRTTSLYKANLLQHAIQKSRHHRSSEMEQLKASQAAAWSAIQHFTGFKKQHRLIQKNEEAAKMITIRSYHNHLKNHTIKTNLRLKLGTILGRGGNAIVLQAHAVDRFTQTMLGTSTVAIKILYAERYRTSNFTENNYLELFNEEIRVETLPLTYAGKSGKFDSAKTLNEKGGFLTLLMSSELSPYFDGEVVLCGGYVFYSRILIFDIMLIDVRSLILPCPVVKATHGTSEAAGPYDYEESVTSYNNLLTTHNHKHNAKNNDVCHQILSMDQRIYIAKEMLIRVAAFHSMGLVHFDVKPANFLISTTGKVVLSDFGFSTPAGAPIECGTNCTPKYQDPESALCALHFRVLNRDYEYDAWGLGLSMYYVLTNGEYPYGINRKTNIVKGLAQFVNQDPQELAFLNGVAPWQVLDRLSVPNYLIQSITLLLQPRRADRPTPLKVLSMYSEYVNGI